MQSSGTAMRKSVAASSLLISITSILAPSPTLLLNPLFTKNPGGVFTNIKQILLLHCFTAFQRNPAFFPQSSKSLDDLPPVLLCSLTPSFSPLLILSRSLGLLSVHKPAKCFSPSQAFALVVSGPGMLLSALLPQAVRHPLGLRSDVTSSEAPLNSIL